MCYWNHFKSEMDSVRVVCFLVFFFLLRILSNICLVHRALVHDGEGASDCVRCKKAASGIGSQG